MRTDGVHCRESAGTGLVNLKVVPVTGAALAGHHGPTNIRLSFSHYEVGILKVPANTYNIGTEGLLSLLERFLIAFPFIS